MDAGPAPELPITSVVEEHLTEGQMMRTIGQIVWSLVLWSVAIWCGWKVMVFLVHYHDEAAAEREDYWRGMERLRRQMAAEQQKRAADARDDVSFLEWMQRYVGFWSDGSIEYGIRRREDGWLQGYRMTKPAAFVSASWIVQHAHKTGDPPGPLGMRPILVTESLARYWFSETPNGGYPGSIHVSRGREIIVDAVEQKMREANAESIRQFWRSQWAAWPRKPLDADDVALFAVLLPQYEIQKGSRS